MKQTRILSVCLQIILAFLLFAAPAMAIPHRDNGLSRTQIKRMVVEEAMQSSIPPELALAVAKVESDFQAHAESHAGARGVMQIMPATARNEFGVPADRLWDARLNIKLGIQFLEHLITVYHGRWDIALSHYNGGSAVGKWPNVKVIPVTQTYVNKVLRIYRRYSDRNIVAHIGVRPPTHTASLNADNLSATGRYATFRNFRTIAWNNSSGRVRDFATVRERRAARIEQLWEIESRLRREVRLRHHDHRTRDTSSQLRQRDSRAIITPTSRQWLRTPSQRMKFEPKMARQLALLTSPKANGYRFDDFGVE